MDEQSEERLLAREWRSIWNLELNDERFLNLLGPAPTTRECYAASYDDLTSLLYKNREVAAYLNRDEHAIVGTVDTGDATSMGSMNTGHEYELHTHIDLPDRKYSPPSGSDMTRIMELAVQIYTDNPEGEFAITPILAPEGVYIMEPYRSFVRVIAELQPYVDVSFFTLYRNALDYAMRTLWLQTGVRNNPVTLSIDSYLHLMPLFGYHIVLRQKACTVTTNATVEDSFAQASSVLLSM